MSKTIEVSNEVWEKIKEFIPEEEVLDVESLSDFIGQKLFIRTVTYHMVGRVVKIVGNLFQMEDASWVADSGRFMNAIKEGSLEEVEPVGTAFVNISAIVDMFPWEHKLPKEQR